jgi:2-methylcitrate dehydratase PrpD
MNVTNVLAEFISGLRYDQIPPEAIQTAKRAILDCLGVALAGSREEDAKICAEIARQEGAVEESVVLGSGFKSSAMQAGFANGTAAHALDFDHSFTLMGQPTAPIIPAAFALADSLGATGRQLVESYVAGFEVAGKLVHTLRETPHDGWHGPGSMGAFGASAACSKLLGLTAAHMQMALGITASMASAIVANFGTMTKPLHVGMAARNGILAAKLAQSGFTANRQAIEGNFGFYKVLHPNAVVDETPLSELGRSFALVSDPIRVKPYPCGGLTHQAIDSVLALRAEHKITAEAVESIDVDVTKHTFDRIVFRIPQNGIQGKFSMNYLLARAIIDGRIGLHIFTDETVRNPDVVKLAERVEMHLDPNLKGRDPGGRPCRVTIRLRSGEVYSREAQHAKGSPGVPISQAELESKFMECAQEVLSESTAQRALEYIGRIERLEDVRLLSNLLLG